MTMHARAVSPTDIGLPPTFSVPVPVDTAWVAAETPTEHAGRSGQPHA